jgi:hypothetical protein
MIIVAFQVAEFMRIIVDNNAEILGFRQLRSTPSSPRSPEKRRSERIEVPALRPRRCVLLSTELRY